MEITADVLKTVLGIRPDEPLSRYPRDTDRRRELVDIVPAADAGLGISCVRTAARPGGKADPSSCDAPVRSREGSPLVVLPRPEEAAACEPRRARFPRAFAASPSDIPEAVELLTSALWRIQQWDCDLKEALIEEATAAEMAEVGARLFPHPFAVIDRKLSILAQSPNYGPWSRSSERQAPVEASGFMAPALPVSAASDLIEDEGYHRAALMEEPFYYPFDAPEPRYFGVNMFVEGKYAARFVACLPEGRSSLDPGERALALHLCRHLFALLGKRGEAVGMGRSANDRMHAALRGVAGPGEAPDGGAIEAAFDAYGWQRGDELVIVKMDFFEGPSWESALPYLCNLLEVRWHDSCAIDTDRSVVWLVNATAGGTSFDNDAFMRSLGVTITDYACRAGVSRTFRDPLRMRPAFVQACAALEIGQHAEPHHWYHLFGDHALGYILSRAPGDLSPEGVAHPGILRLLDHDRARGTDLAGSLSAYLACDRNTTHAADRLFIHRTSLLRRLERIKEVAGIDALSLGEDEKLHILLTFRLLEGRDRDSRS